MKVLGSAQEVRRVPEIPKGANERTNDVIFTNKVSSTPPTPLVHFGWGRGSSRTLLNTIALERHRLIAPHHHHNHHLLNDGNFASSLNFDHGTVHKIRARFCSQSFADATQSQRHP